MAEPKRRAAVRNMVDGLFVHEHITTTTARAKVVSGTAEKLIAIAIRGHNKGWAHLKSVVDDDYVAEQVLALARRGNFTLGQHVLTNEEREQRDMYPISAEARKIKEDRLAALQKDLLGLIKDRDEAQRALIAARE